MRIKLGYLLIEALAYLSSGGERASGYSVLGVEKDSRNQILVSGAKEIQVK